MYELSRRKYNKLLSARLKIVLKSTWNAVRYPFSNILIFECNRVLYPLGINFSAPYQDESVWRKWFSSSAPDELHHSDVNYTILTGLWFLIKFINTLVLSND